jgi:hypothetical protein
MEVIILILACNFEVQKMVTKNLSNMCLEFELFHEIKSKDNEYIFLVSCDITC